VSAGTGAFTTWWAHRYTRGLPMEVRDRRRDEITSDVFEQLHATSEGRPTSITWRTLRGIPADVSWRRQEMRAMRANSPEPRASRVRNTWAVMTQRWFAPLALLIVVFDLLFAIAVVQEDGSKMPGRVVGPVILTLCAAATSVGLWLRWRAGRAISARVATPGEAVQPVSRRVVGGVIAILVAALALMMVGVARSTGGVVLFLSGMALILGTAAVLGGRAFARALRSSNMADKAGLADGLIVIGTLPALAMFWMIIPPILALTVIGGVIGTSPKFRTAA
jgi:hypothetical protein